MGSLMHLLSIKELSPKTLRHLIEDGKVLIYIDDELIMSNTINDGLSTLREVLTTLTGAGFLINLKNVRFWTLNSSIWVG